MCSGQSFVPDDIKAKMKERTNWGDLLSSDKLEYPPAEEIDHLFNQPDGSSGCESRVSGYGLCAANI